jgi:beta-galactosidase
MTVLQKLSTTIANGGPRSSHDWSIEGSFRKDHPTTFNQSFARRHRMVPKDFYNSGFIEREKISIEFDGVYRNSEVWINGHYLGRRPNGYISFRYELTPYLEFGAEKNLIAVKVDNSTQPNSRWYTGSGIYRNVRLITTNMVAIDAGTVFIHTKNVTAKYATVIFEADLREPDGTSQELEWIYEVHDATGKLVTSTNKPKLPIVIPNPKLWSPDRPNLYRGVVKILKDKKVIDTYETTFGIRDIRFDAVKGFFLNNHPLKDL